MRIMIKFRFPAEAGNSAIRSGKVEQVFQHIMEDLKPEAAYFFPEGGERAGLFVVEMQESSQVADIPTVSPLIIPLLYCHINGFQRASSVEKPWPGGENRMAGWAAHPVEW